MDIGLQEVLLISVIALLVLGPERLPTAIRSIAITVNRLKRSFDKLKAEIEREIDADQIREQIHNENVLNELGEPVEQLQQTLDDFTSGRTTASNESPQEPTQQ